MKNKNIVWFAIIIGLMVIAAIVIGFIIYQYFWQWDVPFYGHMMGGMWMPYGIVGIGLFCFIILYYVGRSIGDQPEYRPQSPIDQLKSRLARGEISIEEYERLLEKIKEDR